MKYLLKNIENQYWSVNTFFAVEISWLEQDDLWFFSCNIIINWYLSQEAFENSKSYVNKYKQLIIDNQVKEFYKISEGELFNSEWATSKEKLKNVIIQRIITSVLVEWIEKNIFTNENWDEVNFINSEIIEL